VQFSQKKTASWRTVVIDGESCQSLSGFCAITPELWVGSLPHVQGLAPTASPSIIQANLLPIFCQAKKENHPIVTGGFCCLEVRLFS